MIDSHCHIDLPIFDADRLDVLQSAKIKGVKKVLVPGLGLEQSKQLLVLKQLCLSAGLDIDIAAGFHPYFLSDIPDGTFYSQLDALGAWLDVHQSKVVAIGEFGLDGSLPLSMAFQESVFIAQLRLAQSLNKPVVLHHRQSHNELIRLLKQAKFTQGGVIHAFSGSEQIAHTYVDMGFCLGVGGTITYPRGAKTRRALMPIPLSSLLLETDAPDMPVCGYQGQRNTPERLGLIAQSLANLKNVDTEQVIQVSTAAYNNLFSSTSAL
ncbi:TatD family hydrolase [Glaciecola siphonariae]|uniref:TatD family hydrolase n=1 Tax=Glaciecola siphonariae TaxID=521012 RepID=A0ABV9M2B3_9ALTE